MDAVEFLKEIKRMCGSYEGDETCNGCPLDGSCFGCYGDIDPEKTVAIAEQWSKDHPKKTRQSEFLKMFPNVFRTDEIINISPCVIDTKVGRAIDACEQCDRYVVFGGCVKC